MLCTNHSQIEIPILLSHVSLNRPFIFSPLFHFCGFSRWNSQGELSRYSGTFFFSYKCCTCTTCCISGPRDVPPRHCNRRDLVSLRLCHHSSLLLLWCCSGGQCFALCACTVSQAACWLFLPCVFSALSVHACTCGMQRCLMCPYTPLNSYDL